MSGGRIVGRRLATIDLPDPGDPIIMMLCPPAAATSMARTRAGCPLTSLKSTEEKHCCWANSSRVLTTVGSSLALPARKSITSLSDSTPYTSRSLTTAASRAFSFGTITPLNFCSRAIIAIGSIPLTGCKVPSRDSSPAITKFAKGSSGMISLAARRATAMGRSKTVPSLRTSPGLRLMTVLWVLGCASLESQAV